MLQELLAQNEFELLLPEDHTANTTEQDIRLVYQMNDTVESFLVFRKAIFTGTYKKDYEGKLDASYDRDQDRYVLGVRQGDSVITLFYQKLELEVNLYNYGEIAHFWVPRYENLRQLEFRIAVLWDKYTYLGENYCSEGEKRLVHLAEHLLGVVGIGVAAPLALDPPVAALGGENLLRAEAGLFKLPVHIGAEQEELFALQCIQQRFVQGRHVQVDAGDQRHVGEIGPAALLIGEGVKAGGIHVLHIGSFPVGLLKFTEVFLEELAAVLGSGGSAHPGACAQQHIVRRPEKACGPVDLPGIGQALGDIVPGVVSGEKVRKARFLSGVSVEHTMCLLDICWDHYNK